MDGGVFETSGKQDVEVRVAPLIPGLKSAIKLMPVGSKWEIYIPPHLGFGQLGKPPKVGPDMVLIYEVSLLGIRNINEKDKVIKRSSESAGEERSVNSQLNEKNELSNSKKIKRKSKLVGQ
jgi:hypothetical protein